MVIAGEEKGTAGRVTTRRSAAAAVAAAEELLPSGMTFSPQTPPPPTPPPTPQVGSRTATTRVYHSRRLHDFSLPPSLKWGTPRLLRCSNLSDSGPSGSAGDRTPSRAAEGKRPCSSSSSPSSEKTIPSRPSGSKHGASAEDPAAAAAAAAAAAEAKAAAAAARPWNLRTRRAACNAPANNGRHRNSAAENISAAKTATRTQSDGSDKKLRRKFSNSLMREEIEEDFLTMKGSKPPRRPKKRPRIVQQQLDVLFPGCWLSEITMDKYKTDE